MGTCGSMDAPKSHRPSPDMAASPKSRGGATKGHGPAPNPPSLSQATPMDWEGFVPLRKFGGISGLCGCGDGMEREGGMAPNHELSQDTWMGTSLPSPSSSLPTAWEPSDQPNWAGRGMPSLASLTLEFQSSQSCFNLLFSKEKPNLATWKLFFGGD